MNFWHLKGSLPSTPRWAPAALLIEQKPRNAAAIKRCLYIGLTDGKVHPSMKGGKKGDCGFPPAFGEDDQKMRAAPPALDPPPPPSLPLTAIYSIGACKAAHLQKESRGKDEERGGISFSDAGGEK